MNIVFRCECGNEEVKNLMDNSLEKFEINDKMNESYDQESYLKCLECNREERYY